MRGTVKCVDALRGLLVETSALSGLVVVNPDPLGSTSPASGGEKTTRQVITSVGSATFTLSQPYSEIVEWLWDGVGQPGVLVTETNPGAGIFDFNFAPAAGVLVTIIFNKA